MKHTPPTRPRNPPGPPGPLSPLRPLACLMLALAVAPYAPLAWSADSPAVRQLVEQAQYWQQKKRDDLAADAWRKLLRVDPKHPLALVQMGSIEARAGHTKEAEKLLGRVRALDITTAGVSELETALKVQSAEPSELSAAREHAQAGKPEEAVKTFRNILGTTKPAGQFGLEYYQTLGGTTEGWDEARAGLEQLARSNPGDSRYLLALARHLTFRETTRREGIRQLVGLAQHEPGAQEAQKGWRQALAWLAAKASDKPLFQQYLTIFPDDQAVRERMRTLNPARVASAPQRPSLKDLERQAGFRLLQEGDIEKAEARFRAILAKNPRDADAMGGLATVMMQRELFAEASSLLDAVVKSSQRAAKNWGTARNSAHYWTLIQEINDLLATDKNGDLEGKLQQALKLDPREPAGLLIQADLLSHQHAFAKAEALYRQVLKKTPDSQGAFLGLASILSQTGREREALAMIATQTDSGEMKMIGLNQTKAQAMLKLAQADEEAHNDEVAAERLEDAMLLDPLNPWVRLALARLYQRLGDGGGANSLIDNLLATNPDMPEALHARALLFAEQQQPWDALQTLERIPAEKRTNAMAADQRRLWITIQVQRATQYFTQGQIAQSNQIMAEAQSAAGTDLGYLGQVAGGWSALNKPIKALQVMRDIAGRSLGTDAGTRIQYAGILLNTHQDTELSAVLRDLAKSTSLSSAQQNDINKIITAYTLRQTDGLREAGRLAEAFDVISPALEQSDDARLLMALARIYNAGGEPAQALQIAEGVIAREPDELDHRLFAAGAAMAAKQLGKAAGHAAAALELAPDHPRALALAGRVEKAQGNLSKALEYFQYAQALEREKGAFAAVPGNLALRLVDDTPAITPITGAARAAHGGLLPIPSASASRAGAQPYAQPYQQQRPNLLPIPGAGAAMGSSATGTNYAPAPAPRRPFTKRPPIPSLGLPADTGYVPSAPPQRQFAPQSAAPAYRPSQALARYAPPQALPQAQALPKAQVRPQATAQDYQLAPARPRPLPAAALFASAPRDTETAPLVTPTTLATANAATPDGAQAGGERTLADEIADIELKFATTIDVGAAYRNRSGEVGLNRLSEVELPIEIKTSRDYSGTITMRLTPVLLSAGELILSDPANATRFGTLALGPFLATPAANSVQEAGGLGLSIGYATDRLAFDIGVSPLGFKVRNLVGGISLSKTVDDLTLKASLNRRSISDSILSYSGVRDPNTGAIYGGVVKTGLRIDAAYNQDGFGLSGSVNVSTLIGRNVKNNSELEAAAGFYWRAYQSLNTRATVGLNLNALGYRYNLSHFTLGHGGYFSPQRYVNVGIPVDVTGRWKNLSYQVGADLSVRHSTQDATDYFPDTPSLQAAWVARIAANAPLASFQSTYAGDISSGAGLSFYTAFEYLIAPQFSLGGRLAFDNSRNYTQQTGLLYLRYALEPLQQPVTYPPRTLHQLYLGDPL
jgi:tetratricopeptide (TPR) repeat protein